MTPDATQSPPELGNQFESDRVLQSYLRRTLPTSTYSSVEPDLWHMGDLAGNELYELQQNDLENEPSLTRWGPWGDRIDRIEPTDVWTRAEQIAAERGIVATAYDREHGPHNRVIQMALAYLFIPSTDMYGCPLAMTDGAARTLQPYADDPVLHDAVSHLTSRDPTHFWTSGQWMTEITGGSDVSRTKTTARQTADGTWQLYGRKWFTSAVSANMALALARPEANGPGSEGLALFYVPVRQDGDLADGIFVNRLKSKLGTRKLPTAELHLEGARAHLVTDEPTHGTRHIAPMLRVTRTWNAVTAAAYVRRGLALARDYARKRVAFDAPLMEHPLHRETLADVQAHAEGMLHLSFRVVELLGQQEAGTADADEEALLQILTPIAKLTTGKQAVAGTSEVVEAFGGAGYVEDTGIPPLLRDAQVLPIWEGTTNVLSLDLLRTLQRLDDVQPLAREIRRHTRPITNPHLQNAVEPALQAMRDAREWFEATSTSEPRDLQAGARRFAQTIGLALEVVYTARHAQWALDEDEDARSARSAERLARRRINRIEPQSRTEAEVLATDQPCTEMPDRYASPPTEVTDDSGFKDLLDAL